MFISKVFQNLIILDIGSTFITDQSVKSVLSKNSVIQTLRLSTTKITNESCKFIAQAPSLTSLDLKFTNVGENLHYLTSSSFPTFNNSLTNSFFLFFL